MTKIGRAYMLVLPTRSFPFSPLGEIVIVQIKKLLSVLVEVLDSRAQYTVRSSLPDLRLIACPLQNSSFPSADTKSRTYNFKASLFMLAEIVSLKCSAQFIDLLGLLPLIHLVFCLLSFLSSERKLRRRGRMNSATCVCRRYRRLV